MKKVLLGLALSAAVAVTASATPLFKQCVACHGAKAEKHALGKSQIIAGWPVDKIEKALHGYKNGTYGGPMKGVMKGQVAKFNDAQIKELATYISGLK